MAISFACVCGKQLKVNDEFAGKRARCPACAGVVVVPHPVAVVAVAAQVSAEDAAFQLLSQGGDPEPASPRPFKREEAFDETPYRVSSSAETPAESTKVTRTIPKFKGRKIERREAKARERPRISISPAVMLSIAGIVVFGGLNLLTLANGWFSVWLLVLLGGSIINLVRGLLGLSED